MASLFVIQGADQGKRFEFTSSPLALGRDSSNAIRLQDTEISRRHAELRRESDGYRVVDLRSANGTFVNGKPVDRTPLALGRPGPAWPDRHALSRGKRGHATATSPHGSICWRRAVRTTGRPS